MSVTQDYLCQYVDGNLMKAELEKVALIEASNTHSQIPTARAVYEFGGGGGGGDSSYRTSFVNADLTAGVLAVNHALSEQYVIVVVYDNSENEIIPDEVTLVDADNLNVDLSSYGTLAGTWNVAVLAAGASGAGESNTASSLGTGADVYKQKVSVDLEFRSIKSSDGSVTVTQNADDIDLAVPSSSSEQLKGWLSYDGSIPAIHDSFNVSSVVKNGTGDYTIYWDTNFANNDYAVTIGGRATSAGAAGYGLLVNIYSVNTNAVSIKCFNMYPDSGVGPGVSAAATDPDYVYIMATGDQ